MGSDRELTEKAEKDSDMTVRQTTNGGWCSETKQSADQNNCLK